MALSPRTPAGNMSRKDRHSLSPEAKARTGKAKIKPAPRKEGIIGKPVAKTPWSPQSPRNSNKNTSSMPTKMAKGGMVKKGKC